MAFTADTGLLTMQEFTKKDHEIAARLAQSLGYTHCIADLEVR